MNSSTSNFHFPLLSLQFGMFETLVSAIVDLFPKIRQKWSVLVAGSLAVLQFFAGLICVTRGGIYVLQLMDWYSSPLPLMLISLCECIAIAWAYGKTSFTLSQYGSWRGKRCVGLEAPNRHFRIYVLLRSKKIFKKRFCLETRDSLALRWL